MHFIKALVLVLVIAGMFMLPAYAAQDNAAVSGRAVISLGDFDVVIGDLGDRYSSWNDSATRVRVTVQDGRRTREHYFDSLPAARYVLRQMYGEPQIVGLSMRDYSGQQLIDGSQAYYVWDDARQSRGGLPLVLAFSSHQAALDEARTRNSDVVDYSNVVKSLDSWEEKDRDRIYWRGSERSRWNAESWNNAWNNRWKGWAWNHERGWSKDSAKADKVDHKNIRSNQGKSDRARSNEGPKNKGEKDKGKKNKGGKNKGNGNGKGRSK